MFMSKLKLIIGIVICTTFSLLVANVVVEAFSQAVSNKQKEMP